MKPNGPKLFASIDDEEKNILERICHYRKPHEGNKPTSFSQIGKQLNCEGLRTRQGKLWNAIGRPAS